MTTRPRIADLLGIVRQDLSFGVRGLRRQKTFAVTAALTIALGIAATTVALSIANGVLLESPPIPEPDRVVSIWEFRSGDVAESMEGRLLDYARYEAYRDATGDVFEVLAGHSYGHFSVGSADGAFAVDGFLTSGNYFTMLGIAPALGAYYSADDEPTVVISERLWRSRFGADPDMVGTTVSIDSRPFTLGAVAREGFVGTLSTFTGDVWIPAPAYAEGRARTLDNSDNPNAAARPSLVVPTGRLRSDLSLEQAGIRIDEIARRVRAEEDAGLRITGARLEDSRWRTDLMQFVRIGLGTLIATAAMLLLIACANLSSLMLTRGHQRQREIAIRLAMGSGRLRIVQQIVTENLILFVAGGLGGVALAWVVSRSIAAIELPLNATITLDVGAGVRVMAIGVGLAALLGVVFGLEPARQVSALDLNRSLKDGGHTVRRSRTWAGIVVAQISVATLLLVLAGLTSRSFLRIVDVDLGFDPDGVVVATLDLASHGYDEAEGRAFYDELRRRVRALPGVEEVSLAEFVALRGASASNGARPVDRGADAPSFSVNRNVVDPQYAEVNGLELVAGRFISARDAAESTPVAVVNQRLASRLWPEGEPLGRRFRSVGTDYEVVGVVRDGVYSFTFEDPKNHAYFSDAQRYRANRSLHVRGPDPAGLIPRLRATLAEMDPAIALQAPALMTDVVAANRFMPRFLAGLTAVFALTGLFLAVVGVYGMLVQDVYRRFLQTDADEGHYVTVARITTVVLTVLMGVVALWLETALQAFQILLQIGAGTGLVFLLRWFWWRINAWSELSAMVISFAVAVWFEFGHVQVGLPDWSASMRLVMGVVITTIGWVVVTFLTRPTDEATLRTFYDRMRPVGSGWRAVVGEQPAPDGESVSAAALAWFLGCVAVYAALFGTGYALYGQVVGAVGLGLVAAVAAVGVVRLLPRVGLR